MLRERRGNSAAMDVVRDYWPRSGRISGLCAGDAATCSLMDEGYAWDAAGNLTTTMKETRYLENYTYDNLNRLTLAKVTMMAGAPADATTFNGSYDALGNICRVYGTPFTYEGRGGCGTSGLDGGGGSGPVGPHRVSQTTSQGGVVSDYYYDIRGNQTLRDQSGTAGDRAIRYSLDNKAYEISLGGTVRTRFWYGPDGQRYKRVHDGKTTLYLGNVEIETAGGVTTTKRNVAGVLQQSIVGAAVTSHYLFHDQLGSVVRTTTATGTIVDNLDYRHFGYRRSFTNPGATTETVSGVTSRGFTGHEHVDGTNLNVVHMNGRIYDPSLHRFLQADPVIQAPGNLQSWNAYTYVFNNPLAYTDPTGMISLRQVLGIVIVVVAAMTQQYWAISAASKFWGAVAVGALAGGVSTGTWQGAMWGAFSAAAFYGVGAHFEGARWAQATDSSNVLSSGLNAAGYGAKVLAHGATGGVMSKLQGGKFGHGFASAGVTQAFAPGINRIGGGASSYAGARVAAAAVLGGTASKLSGGKFANGAITAAFSRAFNDEYHRPENEQDLLLGEKEYISEYSSYDSERGHTQIGWQRRYAPTGEQRIDYFPGSDWRAQELAVLVPPAKWHPIATLLADAALPNIAYRTLVGHQVFEHRAFYVKTITIRNPAGGLFRRQETGISHISNGRIWVPTGATTGQRPQVKLCYACD